MRQRRCSSWNHVQDEVKYIRLRTFVLYFIHISDKTSAYRIAQERNSIVQLFPKSLKYLKSINCLSFALLKVEKLLDLFCILCIVKVNRLQAQQLSYWKYFLQGLANSSRGNAEEGRIKLLLLRSYLFHQTNRIKLQNQDFILCCCLALSEKNTRYLLTKSKNSIQINFF